MTSTTLSPALFGVTRSRASEPRRGLTLEERLDWAWEGLHADGIAACPVCRGRMERSGAEARCTECGSALG